MRIYCTKFFGRVVQSESKVSRSSYLRKKLVGIFISFFIFSVWAVTSQTFDKKITTGLPKLPSTFSEIFKGEKLSYQKKSFPSVSDFELRIFGLLVKKIGRLTKTALYVSRGDYRRKKSFELKSTFSISLWNWADDFQDSGHKCRKYYQSCILPVQTVNLLKTVLEKKNSTVSNYQGKNLRISAGKCLEEISEGTISAKKGISNHLLSLGEKVSNFSPKVLIRAVRTAFYVSKGWILGKNLEVYSSLIFSDTAQNFWDLMPRAFAGLSIIHFTRPKGVFGRNFCLKSALHIHGYQAVIGGLFCKKFFGRVVQSESKVSRSSYFRKKNCWNIYHFFYFWTVSSNFSDFWQKNHDWVAENSLYGFRVFWARKTVSPGKIFPISFWLWANVFRGSGQKVRKVN